MVTPAERGNWKINLITSWWTRLSETPGRFGQTAHRNLWKCHRPPSACQQAIINNSSSSHSYLSLFNWTFKGVFKLYNLKIWFNPDSVNSEDLAAWEKLFKTWSFPQRKKKSRRCCFKLKLLDMESNRKCSDPFSAFNDVLTSDSSLKVKGLFEIICQI